MMRTVGEFLVLTWFFWVQAFFLVRAQMERKRRGRLLVVHYPRRAELRQA